MTDILEENLKLLWRVEKIEQVPEDFRKRCERVEKLIQRMKLYGGIVSTQVLAMMAEQREREMVAKGLIIDTG